MKKLPYVLAWVLIVSTTAFAEESKAPQDQVGKAATSAADNVGKSASQLANDVGKGARQTAQDAQKGTGTILDSVGKFLQEIGHNLSGNSAPAPTPASQSSVQPTPTSPNSAQQVETQSPATK